ncbi:hypothetical protein [Desulfosporosinus sp. FKB]|uniref:hypothetical protein n=1 Tax=Desulfosporosinus sp. FKB TaxID=1969835 RepID=UPI000B49F5B0|nr:hypothetical protein [Desulfosporosinus sp. FKB]
MSLSNNVLSVASRQYVYKLKANTSGVYSLIFIQVLALLFSLSGIQSMSSASDTLIVNVKYYSGDIMIAFTFIWIFFMALRLTSINYRTMDFTLVTNRLSSHLSNVGLLLTAIVFGGISSSLMGFVLKIIMYFAFDRSQIGVNGFYPVVSNILLGIITTGLYMTLIASMGYLLGILIQIHVLFVVLYPSALFGLARVNPQVLKLSYDFFASETSPLIFAIRIILSSLILFSLSCLLSNRMEVRK